MAAAHRRPGTERREQIADAALAVIGSRGLSALTTSTLAEEVGVTTGALFRHFPSREAILEAAVARAASQLAETFPDADLPPTERLRALARARVKLLSAEPGIAWLLHSPEASQALPTAAVQQLGGMVKRSRTFIAQALKDGAAEGAVRDDVPPQVLLFSFTATVHALIRPPGARAPIAVDRALDGIFQLFAPPGA
ncbi:MAG: TetR/AcrR family transcriptional regulator [Planctomycetota bacterium]|nr:TetR/AcrR family transcriptional regulator [Planctomycetota bacterium]